MTTEQDLITEVRISLARLEAKVETKFEAVERKLDEAVVSRDHLEVKLAPIVESMNRGKGALAAATLMAGAIGATVATMIKQLFHGGQLP